MAQFSTLAFSAENLTDQQAQELGMTLVEKTKTYIDRQAIMGINKSSIRTNSQNSSSFEFDQDDLDIAKIVVVINKGNRTEINPQGQTLRVYQDGVYLHEFDTSTGTEKSKRTTSGRVYRATTPKGIFRPTRAFKEYQSAAFRGANMDYAVFFTGGIAIHSTSQAAYRNLGKRASGGCARLRYEDAKTVNEIIRSTGEGHNNMTFAGFEELIRNLYTDRVKLPYLNRFTGDELGTESVKWTYDTAIIVTE
jgi:lipoprotein-anchoring transpeptidase ErfK/SrfK